MKKIGILTLSFDNCGTRLQSYALCKILKQHLSDEFELEVVDTECTWRNRNQSPIVLAQKMLKAYGLVGLYKIYELVKWIYANWKNRHIDHTEERVRRDNLFKRIKSMIPYTNICYSCDAIRKGKLPNYDIVLVGSDQVWNGIKVGNQDVYMLDFLDDVKGLTYAASFGMTTFPKDQFEDYKRRINNFSSLLIRETGGVKMCEQLGRDDAKLVLDPTLLLQKDDYNELLDGASIDIKEKYILVYSLNQSYKIYDEAYRLAKKNGYTMIALKRSFCPPEVEKKYPGAKELYVFSPEDFIKLIDNATCVVTNSYHALLFSVNFRSLFYLYLDNADEENSRLLSLTTLLNLDSQVFFESGRLPEVINPIDYSHPHEVLKLERAKSMQLLFESINKYQQ